MKEAIELAIRGGWKPEKHRAVIEFNPNNRSGVRSSFRAALTHNDIFADPLFWQALGKALKKESEYVEFSIWRSTSSADIVKTVWYIAQMHMFIDHLIEGKDLETFFTHLLH